jgi:arylsulfatase A
MFPLPLITALLGALFSSVWLAASPPNIIYILADDLGYGDLSVYNPDGKIRTPVLDQLAAQGMRLTDAHSPSSVCTPTRYGIMTGEYCWRTPLKQGVTWSYGRLFLDPERETVAGLLRQHGYSTAVVGKWHLGLDWALREGAEHQLPNATKRVNENGVIMDMDPIHVDYTKPVTGGPENYGFAYSFILPASLDIPPYCFLENHRLVTPPTAFTAGNDLDKGYMEAFWREGHMAPDFVFDEVLPTFIDKSIAFIRQHDAHQTPFFLYLPLASPHTPWVPQGTALGRSEGGLYGDFVEQMDREIGRLLDALEASGMEDETLVIFTSDNGPYWVPELTARFGHRAAGSLRGMKGDIWEGGHRVPYLARWPGTIAEGTTSAALTSLTHFIATAADIVGLDQPNQYGPDSYSILPVLLGKVDTVPEQPGIMRHSSGAHFAWREGPWKFIEKRGSGGFSAPTRFDVLMGEEPAQLYHLGNDPGESENLYFRHPEKISQFQGRLNAMRDNPYRHEQSP